MTIEDLELIFTPRIGDITARRMVEDFGSAERIFGYNYEQLVGQHGVNAVVAKALCDRVAQKRAYQEMAYCRHYGIDITSATDAQYPDLLRDIDNRPHILYSMGDLSILDGSLVAFVGARNKSPYGERATYKLIEELAELVEDLVIVSGLAIGIDATAHRAALDMGVPTIAVLPNSLPEVMPTQNKTLSEAILRRGGLLLSEQSSGPKNIAKTLIARNRILVGISEGTIVVESKVSGGSMRSAALASSFGRELGAVPGRIVDAGSAGCNKLIGDNLAVSITSGSDIVSMLGWHGRLREQIEICDRRGELTEDQVLVLRCFKSDEPMTIDDVVEECSLPRERVQGVLMELDIEGYVGTLPGGLYERFIPLEEVK